MPKYGPHEPAEPLLPESECGHSADRQEVTRDHVVCLDCGALWLAESSRLVRVVGRETD